MGNCLSHKDDTSESNTLQEAKLPPEPTFPLLRAVYPYEPGDSDELRLVPNDLFFLLEPEKYPNELIWLKVKCCQTNETGYIPSNYVIEDNGQRFRVDAYFDVVHKEANKLLMMMGNPSGTYIVRPSSETNEYALSIRFHDKTQDLWTVKHYKLLCNQDGSGYKLGEQEFPTIDQLIDYFKNNDGLCCRLTKPCPRNYVPPTNFKDLEVNRDTITYVNKLGSGMFGEVWLAKWSGRIEVAAKLLKGDLMNRNQFIQEAKSMHQLHHANIVQLLAVCTTPGNQPVILITEYMGKGCLLDFIRDSPEGEVKLENIVDFLLQVAQGMAYLEKNNFVHRDLRAANVLIDKDNHVKVADFGLSRITDDDIYEASPGAKCPFRWTALEGIEKRQFSVKSDVWSFGVLAYEIFTDGKLPYAGMSNPEILNYLNNGNRLSRPNVRVPCPLSIYQIMLTCWKADRNHRPTFASIVVSLDSFSASAGECLTQISRTIESEFYEESMVPVNNYYTT